MGAIAGVDIALWNLDGKLLGLPVYRLLGGPFRTQLPMDASGVPGLTIEPRVASAQRGRLHGGEGVARAGRPAGGRAWRLHRRERGVRGSGTASHGVYWLEDPFPPEDIAGYMHLTAALDMAIASGERECTRWQFEERLTRRAVT
jgi:galactonate dehydratase